MSKKAKSGQAMAVRWCRSCVSISSSSLTLSSPQITKIATRNRSCVQLQSFPLPDQNPTMTRPMINRGLPAASIHSSRNDKRDAGCLEHTRRRDENHIDLRRYRGCASISSSTSTSPSPYITEKAQRAKNVCFLLSSLGRDHQRHST